MEFIKRMKKREFVEMSLKLIASLLAVFVAIILMEAMIYGITLNSHMENNKTALALPTSVAYCIEVKEDKYFVLYYNEQDEEQLSRPKEERNPEWSGVYQNDDDNLLTKAECEALEVKKVVFNAPNAFKFTINGVHFIVMAIVVLAVAGFFVYKFIMLNKEYSKIVDKFNKTGEIEISNY